MPKSSSDAVTMVTVKPTGTDLLSSTEVIAGVKDGALLFISYTLIVTVARLGACAPSDTSTEMLYVVFDN